MGWLLKFPSHLVNFCKFWPESTIDCPIDPKFKLVLKWNSPWLGIFPQQLGSWDGPPIVIAPSMAGRSCRTCTYHRLAVFGCDPCLLEWGTDSFGTCDLAVCKGDATLLLMNVNHFHSSTKSLRQWLIFYQPWLEDPNLSRFVDKKQDVGKIDSIPCLSYCMQYKTCHRDSSYIQIDVESGISTQNSWTKRFDQSDFS